MPVPPAPQSPHAIYRATRQWSQRDRQTQNYKPSFPRNAFSPPLSLTACKHFRLSISSRTSRGLKTFPRLSQHDSQIYTEHPFRPYYPAPPCNSFLSRLTRTICILLMVLPGGKAPRLATAGLRTTPPRTQEPTSCIKCHQRRTSRPSESEKPWYRGPFFPA